MTPLVVDPSGYLNYHHSVGRCPNRGLSDAPLSSGERLGLSSGGFVAPHSADDSVGEVAFVSAPGFASGLALGGLFVDCDALDWSTKASASATSE